MPRSAKPAETPAATSDAEAAAAAAEASWKKGRPITMQYFRPQDKRGINMFETTKDPGVEFTGFKMDFGAGFSAQLQDLSHNNSAVPNVVNGVNANQLMDIGMGFNNPTANVNLVCAAGAWDARDPHQLSVGAAPQRNVGQGRLHPNRSVAHRLGTAEGAHGDRDRARRRLRDQLRRRALPSQRQR